MSVVVRLSDQLATEQLGEAIAGAIVPGDVLLLFGDLGAGKTTLVRGLVRGLGTDVVVTSPTFTLRHDYETTPPLCHVDCWRLKDSAELDDLGLDEVLVDGGVLAIEWGELAEQHFGSFALRVELADADGGMSRLATLRDDGGTWRSRLDAISVALVARGLAVELHDGSRGPR